MKDVGGLSHRDDVDDSTSASGAEVDSASGEREQGVVATATNIGPRVEVGTTLPHDDFPGLDVLTTETLDAEALGVAIAAVPGA